MEKNCHTCIFKMGGVASAFFPASACIADLLSYTCGYPLIMGAFKRIRVSAL